MLVPTLTRRALALLLASASPSLLPRPAHSAQPLRPPPVQTPSGLQYIDFREGSGDNPRWGQMIRFHYMGYVLSDKGDRLESFDSSYKRDQPYLTKHGNGLTCQGIEEGLHGMRIGGRRRIILPAALGFTADKGPLPPAESSRAMLFARVTKGEPIVLDVELLSAYDDLLDRCVRALVPAQPCSGFRDMVTWHGTLSRTGTRPTHPCVLQHKPRHSPASPTNHPRPQGRLRRR